MSSRMCSLQIVLSVKLEATDDGAGNYVDPEIMFAAFPIHNQSTIFHGPVSSGHHSKLVHPGKPCFS